ncbi:TetR/AcrR family transcriptional regulator [Microbacterium sp. PMB16]|uniref:TetR/AcrR family transcriptional regulator n=1 Tax=Microbacterium sp. PMB16 TaxID=3120157 RepID=UPI003F4BE386
MSISTGSRGRPRETSAEEIRDKAWELFAEHGFDNVSIAQVAGALGISRTTMYVYFSNKRDLMSEAFDQYAAQLQEHFVEEPEGSLVDVLIHAMQFMARDSRAEHADVALRRKIIQDSSELRAYAALRTAELTQLLVDFGIARAPSVDPEHVGDLTHALMAVATRATDDWTLQESPGEDLGSYVSARLERFVAAMR